MQKEDEAASLPILLQALYLPDTPFLLSLSLSSLCITLVLSTSKNRRALPTKLSHCVNKHADSHISQYTRSTQSHSRAYFRLTTG